MAEVPTAAADGYRLITLTPFAWGRVDRHGFAAGWDVEMFERFTDRARRTVVYAQDEARMLNHNHIGTEHILLGLVHEGEGVAASALESMGISLAAVRQEVEGIIGKGKHAQTGHIPFTPRAKKVLELSLREAQQLGHNYIGTEHILLGLVREGDGVGAQVLVKLGADLSRVRQVVVQQLQGLEGEQPWARASRRGRAQPGEIVDRLDAIAARLAAIERHLGIEPEQVPAELREFDGKIARLRGEKKTAIEDHDFEKAAALRDMERQLLRQKAEKAKELASAAQGRQPAGAVAGAADVVAAAGEVSGLRAEIGRLQALLREHGIDPGDSPDEPQALGEP